ncbi:hypothetical protein AVEN_87899-1 [Araneus ventricosus]|uniref:Uncharacterized protein n=1 Tax=Araneus ventricosus TaxID=182803 RepID=A0A4Y2BB89_ARAVE|nr:hypothetical protein AVEN_87899-1 [Araneus ventricosus]
MDASDIFCLLLQLWKSEAVRSRSDWPGVGVGTPNWVRRSPSSEALGLRGIPGDIILRNCVKSRELYRFSAAPDSKSGLGRREGESCVMRHRPRCDARRDWLLALRHQNKGNLLATNAN